MRKKEPVNVKLILEKIWLYILDDVVCFFLDKHGRDEGLSRPRGEINNGIPFFGLLQEVNLRTQIRIIHINAYLLHKA